MPKYLRYDENMKAVLGPVVSRCMAVQNTYLYGSKKDIEKVAHELREIERLIPATLKELEGKR